MLAAGPPSGAVGLSALSRGGGVASRETVLVARENPFPQVARSSDNNGAMMLVAQTDIDRETRDGEIVRARLDGLTYKEISEQFDLSISQCQRIFEAARARRRGDYDLDKHHRDVLNDIEDVLDYLRPWVLGESVPDDVLPPPTKNPIGDFLQTLRAKRQFLGLDAPKRTHAVTQVAEPEPVNREAALYLAELAAWARRTNAMNADGFNLALPPGMTERVNVNDHAHTDGHGPGGPHGKSLWSMALENPSED